MVVDVHNHPDWEGHDLPKMLHNMEALGIDVSWLLTWEVPASEIEVAECKFNSTYGGVYPTPFERCISYVERAPERFILGYAPDPRDPRALAKLEAAVAIYGVRVYGELKLRMTYDSPDALRMFRFCGEHHLPVLAHIDYEFPFGSPALWSTYWYGGGLEAYERAIQACPDTTFIGHAPGFWAHISGDGRHDKESYPRGPVVPGGKMIAMLRAYPRLYCDISAGSGLNALRRDTAFAREFLIEFQDRVLYGRDDFHNEHQELLRSLNLPREVLEKILGANALRLVPVSTREGTEKNHE